MSPIQRNTRWTLAALTLSLALLATACGSSGNSANNANGSAAPSSEAPASASPVPSGSADASASPTPTGSGEPLVVYLNDFDEMIKPLFEEKTGYKLELVTGNGAEIMSRIEAEKGNPHWDVVWMDAMPSIHNLGATGQLLEGWTPKAAANLTEFARSVVPDNGAYYPTGAHAAGVIVYNTNAYTEEEAPKTWQELADAKYKDAVGMADPAVAAPAYPFVSWFFQSMGMDGGQTFFDGLFANGARVYPKNPNVVSALSGGEIKAAALQESNAYSMKNAGEPIGIVWPDEGAPASVRVAAIRQGTEREEAAKAFVEFLLDPAVQQQLIDQGEESYFEPSVAGVKPKADRAADAELVVAEAAWAAEHEADIKQWFADKAVK